MRRLEDRIGAHLDADLDRIDIEQPLDPVFDPCDVGVAIPREQIVADQRAFPGKGVKKISRLLIEQSQAVIVGHFRRFPVFRAVKPDRQRSDRPRDKIDAAADRRNIQNARYRHGAAAQSGPQRDVQILIIECLLAADLDCSAEKPHFVTSYFIKSRSRPTQEPLRRAYSAVACGRR